MGVLNSTNASTTSLVPLEEIWTSSRIDVLESTNVSSTTAVISEGRRHPQQPSSHQHHHEAQY